MGCFSWMFCDKDNKKAMRIGCRGGILIPDNTTLFTESYDGYGHIAGKDIYDLVAELNRDFLTTDFLKGNPKREHWSLDAKGETWWKKACERYQISVQRLLDYKSKTLTDEEMEEKYEKYWKREIGIDIACYDDQNAALPYPIKIVSKKDCLYEDLPASIADPDQGF